MREIYQTSDRPVAIQPSVEAQVYVLFAVAMGLSAVGVWLGMQFAQYLMSSGVHLLVLVVQLGILFSARIWMNRYPLNYVLFGIFPTLSGFIIAPYLLFILAGYVNGASIILHAFLATTFMALAAAVFARTTSMNLSVMGRALFMAVIGLIIFGLLQVFVPSMRTPQMEMLISGAGIIIFALFTAYDLQRIQKMSRTGMSPFLLALSLYLDIFNLFLYILRFMLVLSGERR